jgi:EAL domain-containing protein (putative c-di-GMP-specific phosphodiesterase class I)
VNLSAKQLVSRTLPGEVAGALVAHDLDPGALTLEITESTLLDSPAVIGRLDELRTLGVRIAIDDFGTGYSSLNYLRRFPVDTLKIAKAFVDEVGVSAEQDRLVAAILRLGSTMGLETVAEGIELEQQRDRLRALKCRFGQGFLYSRPLPADELDAVIVSARVA